MDPPDRDPVPKASKPEDVSVWACSVWACAASARRRRSSMRLSGRRVSPGRAEDGPELDGDHADHGEGSPEEEPDGDGSGVADALGQGSAGPVDDSSPSGVGGGSYGRYGWRRGGCSPG
ncbi:hypothetical protein GCM10009677_36150 [Sphaerisporangium rubeum]